jgi:hypothetical protein
MGIGERGEDSEGKGVDEDEMGWLLQAKDTRLIQQSDARM